MANRVTRSKAASNRAHAARRARERYDIELTPELTARWEAGAREHRDGFVLLAERLGGRNRNLYGVEHDGEWLPVIYDTATGSVVTLLPPAAIDPYLGLLRKEAQTPAPAPLFLGDLPDPSPPGAGADLGDVDACLDLLEIRRGAIARRVMLGDDTKPVTAALHDELRRIKGTCRELKVRRHELFFRKTVARVVGDPDDPLDVLAVMFVAHKSMAERIGWDNLTPEEHAARKAAEYCLGAHGRLASGGNVTLAAAAGPRRAADEQGD